MRTKKYAHMDRYSMQYYRVHEIHDICASACLSLGTKSFYIIIITFVLIIIVIIAIPTVTILPDLFPYSPPLLPSISLFLRLILLKFPS